MSEPREIQPLTVYGAYGFPVDGDFTPKVERLQHPSVYEVIKHQSADNDSVESSKPHQSEPETSTPEPADNIKSPETSTPDDDGQTKTAAPD